MPHYQGPCDYVFWQKIENHEELKEKYVSIITNLIKNDEITTHRFQNCKFKSSIDHPTINNFITHEDLQKIVWKPLEDMINEINSIYQYKLKPNKSIIKNYWFNIYNKGDFQELHDHRSHDLIIDNKVYSQSFSAIYILNDKSPTNTTAFYNNVRTHYSPFGDAIDCSILDTSLINDINEGTIIIFPALMYHLVKPCIEPGRITLSFNIYSTYANK